MKCRGKRVTTVHELFRIQYYQVFPAKFHVISRKVDYLWDSVYRELHTAYFGTVYVHVPGIEQDMYTS